MRVSTIFGRRRRSDLTQGDRSGRVISLRAATYASAVTTLSLPANAPVRACSIAAGIFGTTVMMGDISRRHLDRNRSASVVEIGNVFLRYRRRRTLKPDHADDRAGMPAPRCVNYLHVTTSAAAQPRADRQRHIP